jgi:hypothetical protein
MERTKRERRQGAAWTAAALLLFASLLGAVVIAEWPLWGFSTDDVEEPKLVEPAENGTQLWPYTSRVRDYSTKTLGINVVVRGGPEDVEMVMTERSRLEWTETAPEEQDLDPGQDERDNVNPQAQNVEDVVRYGKANGAIRYSYVETDEEGGMWLLPEYQIHSGTYLGQRMHVRAYEDPNGEWTALQAHDEHWDWFRLRHTVTGISDAQREVEKDFMHAPFVESVSRKPYEHATADGDGWATVIRLAMLLAPLGLLATGRLERTNERARRLYRRHNRGLMLGAALFVLYLGIRLVGISLELQLPWMPPRVIAAPLYLMLAVGAPALAYHLGRGTNRTWGFTHAVGGLGTAFVIDFVLMGVSVVPIRFTIHRIAVLLAIGLIAVGSTPVYEENREWPLAIGFTGWILALALPLLGYI